MLFVFVLQRLQRAIVATSLSQVMTREVKQKHRHARRTKVIFCEKQVRVVVNNAYQSMVLPVWSVKSDWPSW